MTLIDEMIAAGRGVLAVLLGRRNAPSYFDLTLRGLAGSFVAFIAAAAFNAYLPWLTGAIEDGVRPWQALLLVAVLYVLQIGFSAIVLNQLKRLDGLVPYMVADNWATFFITILTIVLGFLGFNSDLALLMIAVLVIIIEINLARLIVTLTPLQIVMFLVAQLVGVTIGLIVIGFMMPVQAVTG